MSFLSSLIDCKKDLPLFKRNIPIRRQPLILPSDEPSKVLVESIPLVCNHSDILPSNMPHLHIEVRVNGAAQNPMNYL